jgi:hypothetical protein
MMANEITQTERCGNDELKFDIHAFQDKRIVLGIGAGSATMNLHMGYEDLVSLGDAIQRIIAGEDRYSETKDDCAPIIEGS